jgi:hypothetical protein
VIFLNNMVYVTGEQNTEMLAAQYVIKLWSHRSYSHQSVSSLCTYYFL